jgi:hypothetical protein
MNNMYQKFERKLMGKWLTNQTEEGHGYLFDEDKTLTIGGRTNVNIITFEMHKCFLKKSNLNKYVCFFATVLSISSQCLLNTDSALANTSRRRLERVEQICLNAAYNYKRSKSMPTSGNQMYHSFTMQNIYLSQVTDCSGVYLNFVQNNPNASNCRPAQIFHNSIFPTMQVTQSMINNFCR